MSALRLRPEHLIGCAVGVAIAIVVVVLSGGSAGAFGVLIAAVVCPLLMVAAIWFMAGSLPSRPREDSTVGAPDKGAA